MESWALCAPLLLGVMVVVLQHTVVFVCCQQPNCANKAAPDPPYIRIDEFQCHEQKFSLITRMGTNFPTGDVELDYIRFFWLCDTLGGQDNQILDVEFGEYCFPIPMDTTKCTINICYDIEYPFYDEEYYYPEELICNYSIPCPILSNPLNGEVTLRENSTAFSDANYSCNPGYVIDGVHTRSCQVDGSWSDSEPSCVAVNTTLEVILTTDASYMYAEVGSIVNLTCAVNGTPPLEVRFEEENMNHIDPNAITVSEGSSSIHQEILSFQVLKPGPLHFTCTATVNSTGEEQRSQFVNVTGVVDLNIQICFEIPPVLTCNEVNTSVLPSIASVVATNCGCYLEKNVQNVSLTCLSSCQERLFYRVAVLVEDETDLNTSLHLWASQNELLFVENLELTPNLTCGVLVTASLPSPTCPYTIYTTSQTTTDTVSSQTTTFKSASSPTSSNSSTNKLSEISILIIVLIGIVVLFFAFVLPALPFIVMVCFLHKKGGTSGDFAGEGFDAHVFSFQRQLQEHQYIDNKSSQKSVEAAQINSDLTTNDSIATKI